MTFSEYQIQTAMTEIYSDKIKEFAGHPMIERLVRLCYVGLGLGEVGEIQGKIKKIIRDSDGAITDDARKAIAKELGDVLWYVSQMCTELNITMTSVAEQNIQKLFSRKERGVIQGSGDDR